MNILLTKEQAEKETSEGLVQEVLNKKPNLDCYSQCGNYKIYTASIEIKDYEYLNAVYYVPRDQSEPDFCCTKPKGYFVY